MKLTFGLSDEKAELVKILNNGNARGMPLLRASLSRRQEFEPVVFEVFGPKIVAMRKKYDDEALESRFVTESVGVNSITGRCAGQSTRSLQRRSTCPAE